MKTPIIASTTVLLTSLICQSTVFTMNSPTTASISTSSTARSTTTTSKTSSSTSSSIQESDTERDQEQKFMVVCHNLRCVLEDTSEEVVPPLEEDEASSVKVDSYRLIENQHTLDSSSPQTSKPITPSLTTHKTKGKGCPIFAIASNANGKIYYSSTKKKLQAWDLQHNKSETLAPGKEEHTDTITAITTLSKTLVASGDMSGTVCIWNTTDNTCCNKISSQTKPIVWALTPVDEKTIAVGYCGLPVTFIDIESGERKAEIASTNNTTSLAWLPGPMLVAGCFDGTIKIIDPKSKKVVRVLQGHTESIGALITLEDGRIISGSYDNTITMWNPKNTQEPCLTTLKGHRDAILALTLLPGDLLASGCSDGSVYVWDLCQKEYPRIKFLKEHRGPVTALANYNNTHLVSASLDATIKAWQLTAS